MDIKNQKFNDLALFELGKFTMYELNTQGLDTLMSGEKAFRYSDRYIVDKMDYTDNSKKYIANIVSNRAIYKGDIINLDGDVVYTREDALTFESQHVTYNKKTSIAISKDKYFAHKLNNTVRGTFIKYDNKKNRIFSKNVVAVYKLKEEN
jgi:LPS export ABC transporter protein LptC